MVRGVRNSWDAIVIKRDFISLIAFCFSSASIISFSACLIGDISLIIDAKIVVLAVS